MPPVADTTTLPLLPLLQLTLVTDGVPNATAVGCVTVAVVVFEHPLASVAVKVYVCAVKPLNVPPLCVPTLGEIE